MRRRLTASSRCCSSLGRIAGCQTGRQFTHHSAALGRIHGSPTCDFIDGAAAAETLAATGIKSTNFDTRRLNHGVSQDRWDHSHRGWERNCAIVASDIYVPALNSGRRPSRSGSFGIRCGSFAGAIGGAWGIGAIAATTRSGGNVTTTSVPMRNLDFNVNVPP